MHEALQGNLDFFLIRASRGPFRLKHKTQGPSHIRIPKGACGLTHMCIALPHFSTACVRSCQFQYHRFELEGLMLKLKLLILWPPDVKS